MRFLFFAAVLMIGASSTAIASGNEDMSVLECRTRTTNSHSYISLMVMREGDNAQSPHYVLVEERINQSVHMHDIAVTWSEDMENRSISVSGQGFDLNMDLANENPSGSEIYPAHLRARFNVRSYSQFMVCQRISNN